MKHLLFLLMSIFIFQACSKNSAQSEPETNEEQEEIDQVYTDKWGDTYLLGKVSDSILFEEPYNEWFIKDDASIDQETINELKGQLNDYDLEVFFGSWCEDSQEHLPTLFHILDQTNYNPEQLEMVAVGDEGKWYKESPGGEHEGKNIEYVPTIIVKQNGEELNRIVESPVVSIEKDLLRIISGEDYSHIYE